MEVLYTQQFVKKMKQFLKKHPEMKKRVQKTFFLLDQNPFHPSLRMHELQGKYKGIHSISINLSYRITLELRIEKKSIIPLDIGTHDEVY